MYITTLIPNIGVSIAELAYVMTDLRICRFCTLLIAVAVISGCATVPFDRPKQSSEVITDTADTALGKSVGRWTQAHDGLSGFYPLSQPRAAGSTTAVVAGAPAATEDT